VATPPHGISRRRILQASVWAAPTILVATAAPAAAASEAATSGRFVTISSVTLSNLNTAGAAGYTLDFFYQVYNDTTAFVGTGIEPWMAATDPAFAAWPCTWLFEILSASNAVAYSATGNVVLTHGQSFVLNPSGIAVLAAPGNYTARLTVTSSNVATINGQSFTLRTVSSTTAVVGIT